MTALHRNTEIAGHAGRRRALQLGLAGVTLAATLATTGMHAAAASTPAGDDLRRAGVVDSPSVAIVLYTVTAALQDVSTGQVYGDPLQPGQPVTSQSFGTGFFVSSDGYMVTAGHVAAPTDDAIKYEVVRSFWEGMISKGCSSCGTDPDADAQQTMDAFALINVTKSIAVYTQDQDLGGNAQGLPAQLIVSSPAEERDTAVIKVSGSNFPVLRVGDSDKVQVEDPVSVIGYPGAANELTDAKSMTTPTITTGTVTAKKQSNGVDVLQSDATVMHGNSGGPMINSAGEVVGIVHTGASDTTNFEITSNVVQDLMRQAGVNNQLGQIDKLWRDGLSKFDAHHYRAAADDFSQCVNLNRVQVGCGDYLSQATANFPKDVPVVAPAPPVTASSSSSALPIAGGALVAVVVGGLIVLFVRRARRRTGPDAGAAQLVGTSFGPVAPMWPAPVASNGHDGHLAAFALSAGQPPAWQVVPDSWQPALSSVAVAVAPQPTTCTTCGAPRTGQPFCGGCGTRLS